MLKSYLGLCALGVAIAIALLAGCVSSEDTRILPMPPMSRSSTAPDGNGYEILYRFQGGSDGATPDAGLTAYKGTLYGATALNGSSGFGTAFQITTSGKESVIHGFIGSPNKTLESSMLRSTRDCERLWLDIPELRMSRVRTGRKIASAFPTQFGHGLHRFRQRKRGKGHRRA